MQTLQKHFQALEVGPETGNSKTRDHLNYVTDGEDYILGRSCLTALALFCLTMSRGPSSSPSGTQTQTRISTYFSQSPSLTKKRRSDTRGGEPSDLATDNSDADRQLLIKKPKLNHGGSTLSQWRFDPSQRSSGTSGTASSSVKDKKLRHDQFKRILLEENSVLPCPKSTLEQHIQLDAEEESEEGEDKAAHFDGPDHAFEELTRFFSQTPKQGSGKTRSDLCNKRKNRTGGEIGPSGQSYTPAELQVCII